MGYTIQTTHKLTLTCDRCGRVTNFTQPPMSTPFDFRADVARWYWRENNEKVYCPACLDELLAEQQKK